jgi:hypothetical protein
MKKVRRLARQCVSAMLASVLLCLGVLGGLVSAATDSNIKEATGQVSVSAHAADTSLQYGTIVQLIDQDAKRVAPANNKDLSRMYGVVVDPHQLSLTLSTPALENEAQVATSGTFSVLVSTQEGPIKSGDYITMSAIDGVGMKAGDFRTHNIVLGRAGADFDSKSSSIGQVTLSYEGGSDTETVQLGLIPVAINIQRNPNDRSTKANLPEFLERLGQAIAEKQVSPFRIYLSLFIVGITVTIALIMLHSGVKTALISVGRNPLSKKSIFRGLLEVILTSFLVLIIGMFTVYLLLRL